MTYMQGNRPDDVMAEIFKNILLGGPSRKEDIHAEMAKESKKIYEAHINVGFTSEEALALTCAILK